MRVESDLGIDVVAVRRRFGNAHRLRSEMEIAVAGQNDESDGPAAEGMGSETNQMRMFVTEFPKDVRQHKIHVRETELLGHTIFRRSEGAAVLNPEFPKERFSGISDQTLKHLLRKGDHTRLTRLSLAGIENNFAIAQLVGTELNDIQRPAAGEHFQSD